MLIQKKGLLSWCIYIIVIILSSSVSKKCPAFLGINCDKLLFNCSIQALKLSAKATIYTALHNPRMMLLMIAMYFHKEVARLIKDYFMHLAGEFPAICFTACTAGLLYLTYTTQR